jgi:hypothetical protein
VTRIADSIELDLSSYRPDGSLGPFTTVWVVQSGDNLYVRSAGGPTRPWYRRALASRTGQIRAGGVEADVVFGDAPPGVNDDIDAAYHASTTASVQDQLGTSRVKTRTP